MKNFEPTQNLDPQSSDSQHETRRKWRLPLTNVAKIAGGVALAVGLHSATEVSPTVVSGTASVSAEAVKTDPRLYIESPARNRMVEKAVDDYAHRIMRDLQEHPERAEFIPDSDETTAPGDGILKDTIQEGDTTYTFSLSASGNGAIVNLKNPSIDMERTSSESDGQHGSRTYLDIRQNEKDAPWAIIKSTFQNEKFIASTDVSNEAVVTSHEVRTAAELQHNEQQAMIDAEVLMREAGVSE